MDFVEILNEAEVRFKWINKKTFGECDRVDDTITINIWLILAEVFIHEALHYEHPDWKESRVISSTDCFLKRLTKKEIINLGKNLLLRKTLNGIRRIP